MIRYIAFFSSFSALLATFTPAQAQTVPLVVVELFTSQSCSSCPPADRLLDELANQPNIIALGCHVTYWDHLNWKDTLSQEFCTARQKQYASAMRTNRIYTPQMVVNGQEEFTGSRRDKAKTALSRANNVALISIEPASENKLNIMLPALKKAGDYKIWVIGYRKSRTEALKSGENRGKTVRYTNSAVTLDTLGSWAGEAMSYTITPPNADIDGIAIIAQGTGYGPVIAAGKLEF